jgi:hypothetical protein
LTRRLNANSIGVKRWRGNKSNKRGINKHRGLAIVSGRMRLVGRVFLRRPHRRLFVIFSKPIQSITRQRAARVREARVGKIVPIVEELASTTTIGVTARSRAIVTVKITTLIEGVVSTIT